MANNYDISCGTSVAGYSGKVTVTATLPGNGDVTSSFMVSLPDSPNPGPGPSPGPTPNPTPAKKSKTTVIVLGVIGGIVGLGIVIGVAWYVIKGRQDADVDPYEEDATTGLTGQQEQA